MQKNIGKKKKKRNILERKNYLALQENKFSFNDLKAILSVNLIISLSII